MSERKRIYLCLAHMSEAGLEQKYIKEAFDTNWVVPLGPNVNGFEADLEAFCGQNKRVVALSSGTAAVHLALINCGVKAGDEVLVQSFTFCASSHPITYLGATPVFIDSEKDTWNMDPELLEEAIKDRIAKTGKKPKAIVPVALYGMPYKIDRIMEIANKYDIPVIEDAAEGFGSRYNGQVLGTFGKYGVLSFNGNKMITTSGGGALITNNEDEWREIMMYATQYRESYPYYQHEKIGFNYRMSNICAGIGRGQMTVANEHIAHHKHVQKMYEELLADVPGIHVHAQPATGEYDSNYWLCTITLDENVKIKGQENAYKTICWCYPRGRFRHNRLSTQRQCGGLACLHGSGRSGSPSAVETHAQAALLQRYTGLSERRERSHVQDWHVPACRAIRQGRRCEVYCGLHQECYCLISHRSINRLRINR